MMFYILQIKHGFQGNTCKHIYGLTGGRFINTCTLYSYVYYL